MARRKKNARRRKAIPHPSITGLASGLIVATALNSGYPATDPARGGEPHHRGDSVINNLMDGDFSGSLSRLSHNASELVTATGGRKTLGKAIGVALIGAGAKKFIGNPKLGFSKFYFRI